MIAQETTYAIECLFCDKDIEILDGYRDKEERDAAFDTFKGHLEEGIQELIVVKNPKKVILKRIYE